MKFKTLAIFILSLVTGFTLSAQNIIGTWKTIDDKEGIDKGIIEIYETDQGTVEAKVLKVLDTRRAGAFPKCVDCKGSRKDQPIVGMVIMWDLQKDKESYVDGQIVDPDTGKIWSVYIELAEEDKLKVRGFYGFSLFGRTQYWYRHDG